MESNEVVVTNIPVLAFWIIAIAQILFAIATLAIAYVLIRMIGQIQQILTKADNMAGEVDKQLPGMMGSVSGTLKNVKEISDDARGTTHNVTGAVNRVSHVVSSVAGRLESPVIKGVGVLSGVLAGARALRGRKEKEVIIETDKKRRR